MKDKPNKLYLQIEEEGFKLKPIDYTHSQTKVNTSDLEYVLKEDEPKGWISVDDRLPEKKGNEEVLIDIYNGIQILHKIIYLKGFKWKRGGHSGRIVGVTHWRYYNEVLPVPPQEDKTFPPSDTMDVDHLSKGVEDEAKGWTQEEKEMNFSILMKCQNVNYNGIEFTSNEAKHILKLMERLSITPTQEDKERECSTCWGEGYLETNDDKDRQECLRCNGTGKLTQPPQDKGVEDEAIFKDWWCERFKYSSEHNPNPATTKNYLDFHHHMNAKKSDNPQDEGKVQLLISEEIDRLQNGLVHPMSAKQALIGIFRDYHHMNAKKLEGMEQRVKTFLHGCNPQVPNRVNAYNHENVPFTLDLVKLLTNFTKSEL